MRTFVMSSESRDIPLRNLYPNATGLFLSCAHNGGHARNKAVPQLRNRSPRPLAKLEAGWTKRQLLECGGKRSATPLFFCKRLAYEKSAVVASLCRRSAKYGYECIRVVNLQPVAYAWNDKLPLHPLWHVDAEQFQATLQDAPG